MDSKKDKIIEVLNLTTKNCSDWVSVINFIKVDPELKTGNGSWAQDDRGPLKEYIIQKKYGRDLTDKEFKKINKEAISLGLNSLSKNSVVAIKVNGKKEINTDSLISKHIRDHFKGQTCPILGTSNIEIDHKDGRKNDLRVVGKDKEQTFEDFQPLSKHANTAKRQHCIDCKKTGCRFDAKTIGYNKSTTKGTLKYEGSCVGCYWHDVKDFKSKLK